MRKRFLLAAPLALILLLSGCTRPSLPSFFSRSDQTVQTGAISIYRVSADPTVLGSDLIQAEAYPADGAAQDVEGALALFTAPSEDESLACALPEGVTLDGWSLENGVVTLELSSSFLELSDMAQTTAAFCAALTLCQLDGVDAVTVTAAGQTLFPGLVPADALLKDTDTDPYVRQLRLYFADSQGRYLESEYHSLTLEEEASAERYVMEELLRGPNSAELQSAIPAGTRLLSCATEDGVCTVDLSGEFYENRPRTALGERLAIYSLVNSLTALSGVDSVLLTVEGQTVDTYVYRSLAQPLSWYDEAVGPVSTVRGEFDGSLYLAVPGGTAITALPFRVSGTDYESRAEAVLAALLTCEEPGYPVLFSGSASVMDITVQGSACTVELSESFFVSLPAEERSVAVQSIAATLCELSEISSVRFTVGGGAAVADGVDLSGPWRDFDEIKVE